MKHHSTFLLFIALCCCVPVFAQNKTVALGLFYLPVCGDHVGHVSLSYYQSYKPKHSLGFKTMFTSDFIDKPANYIRTYVFTTDLVHSWRISSKTDRSTWRFDTGISLSSNIQRIPPNDLSVECISGVSEADLLEQEAYNSKSHVQTNFLPGIATAANWGFAVTRHLGFGLGLTMNLYFSQKEPCQLFAMPNLNAAYSF